MTMRSAAEQLARHRFGLTAALQRQAVNDLRRLHKLLAKRHAIDEAKQLEQLRQTERQLQQLRREVARLEDEQVKRNSEPKDQQQQLLVQQTQDMADRLETLRVASAAQSARQAAERLAEKRTDRQASPHLDEAQRKLAAERRRRQVALAELQMARLEAKLAAIVARQQAVVEEIARLDGLRNTEGELQQTEWQSIGQLAERQTLLRTDVVDEAQRLSLLPVFAHLMHTAADGMQQVSDRLEARRPDPPTQQVALQVVAQLRMLAAALKQQQQQLAQEKQPSGAEGKQAGENACQAQALQINIGQLRLLKALQTKLRERTEQWENSRATQPAQRAALAEESRNLAAQQQKLIELAEQFAPEPDEPPRPLPLPPESEALP
jgi:hypothetical protein